MVASDERSVDAVYVAGSFGSRTGMSRTSGMLPVRKAWSLGSDGSVVLGDFAGVGVAAARPRHGAWPHLCAAPFFVYDTSIDGASLVEC